MNKYLKYCVAIICKGVCMILLFFVQIDAQASHLAGADLYITHKSGNTYEIKLLVYRDCSGIGLSSTETVYYSSVSCGQSYSMTIERDTIMEITLPCDDIVTKCSGGTFPGYEKHIYYGEVTLPASCNDWKFFWRRNARNGAITNLDVSGNLYVELFLNSLDAPDNNSPTFVNDPVAFICKDQPVVYKHLANDVNGDSLVYSLITPKTDEFSTVTYSNPFTYDSPLTSNPAFSFDNTNGNVSVTPTEIEVTVLAILVTEYRNGQFIGSTIRDIQLVVIECAETNTVPIASGIDSTTNYNYTTCAQDTIKFDVFSFDPDTGQVITMVWDSSISGAQFTVSNDYNPIGSFYWYPDVSDIKSDFHTFNVTVKDDACPYNGAQTYTFNIQITGLNANFGYNDACLGDTTKFTDMSFTDTTNCSNLFTFTGDVQIDRWYWDFGDGTTDTVQNPKHLYDTANTYLVMLVTEWSNSNGHTDTTYKNVTIISDSTYQADIGVVYTCSDYVTFKDNSTGNPTSWLWQFEGGATSTQKSVDKFLSEDTTTVTLIVGYGENSCVYDTITEDIYKSSNIDVSVVQKGCVNEAITINIDFLGDDDDVDGVDIEFGDGNWSWSYGLKAEENYSYQIAGTYLIEIYVYYNAWNCWENFTQTIDIGEIPTANFEVTDSIVCISDQISFSDSSSGDSLTWNWDFGDGDTDTNQNVTHAYTAEGNYTATLTVTDSNSCSHTFSRSIQTYSSIKALFDNNLVCFGDTTEFIDLSTCGPKKWKWDFGDSSTDTVSNPKHKYNTSGSFNVTLIVFDSLSNSDTTSATVTVLGDTDKANFYWDPNCMKTVQFHDSSLGSPTGWFWDFGDFSTSTDTNPSHTYALVSTYTVTLAVSYSNSCVADTISKQIKYEANLLSVGPDSLCVNATETFNIEFTGDTSKIDLTYWDFDDGAGWEWDFNSQTKMDHKYNTPGTYEIGIYIYYDGWVCREYITDSVTVLPAPTLDFSISDDSLCIGFSFAFSDSTKDSIATWTWDFGDLTLPVNAQNTSHPYSTSGLYNAQLTVTDDNGCIDSLSKPVYVYPEMVASFTADTVCVGDSTQFTDQSNGTTATWNWDFGDGSTDTVQNPKYPYNSAGSFTATLNTVSTDGCAGTVAKLITIGNIITQSVSKDTSICYGDSVEVSASGGLYYSWTPTNGLSDNSISNPIVGPDSSTLYYVAIANNGCSVIDSVLVTINTLPASNVTEDTSVCFNDTIMVNAEDGISYSWSPGKDLNDSTISNPILIGRNSSLFMVTVVDTNGCVNTDSVYVTVDPLPIIITTNDTTICFGDTLQLSVSNLNLNTYSWYPNMNLSDSSIFNPKSFAKDSIEYYVIVTDINDCASKDSVTIQVLLPNVDYPNKYNLCLGDTLSVNYTSDTSYNYLWLPGTSLSDSTIPNPVISAKDSIIYFVLVQDKVFGCTNYDTLNVNVRPLPIVYAGPDDQLCFGDSTFIGFQGSGSDSFLWSPTIGLNDSLISSPWVKATATSNYILFVTDTNGCINSDTMTLTVLPLPVISLAALTSPICRGDSLQMPIVTDGVSYLWTPSQGISNTTVLSPMVSPSQSTTYYVRVTGSNTCISLDSIQINVDTIPVLIISSDTTICIGDTIQLYVAGADDFTWKPDQWLTDPFVASPSSDPQETITYTVTGFNQLCSSIPKSVTIVVLDLPIIDAGNNVVIEKGQSVQLNGTGGTVYSWFPDTDLDNSNLADPLANPADTTKYYLIGTNDVGCQNLDSVIVFVIPSPEDINIPGGFSPNGDDNNDKFFVMVENVSSFKFIVFNRWGEKLFETNSSDNGWDGTHRGVPVNAGVYVYYVEVVSSGNKIQKYGNVTLIR